MVRGKTVHYIKSVNPGFPEQGYMTSPKGRVSPGEGLVKMVRILPGRPPGKRSSSGLGRPCSVGEGLPLGCVGWGRLELVDDLILCWVGLILLHL